MAARLSRMTKRWLKKCAASGSTAGRRDTTALRTASTVGSTRCRRHFSHGDFHISTSGMKKEKVLQSAISRASRIHRRFFRLKQKGGAKVYGTFLLCRLKTG